MHLDCVFSILGDDVCLMMDEMMGKDSPTRRLVDEWTQLSVSPSCVRLAHLYPARHGWYETGEGGGGGQCL